MLIAASLVAIALAQPPQCREWHECRQLALDAAGRGDYEAFHDLAWRAVQAGPAGDTSLMILLARAQSLSGRPGDALVMLQRLADKGVVTDAATSDDFERVRRLPGWPSFAAALESRMPGAPPAAPTDARETPRRESPREPMPPARTTPPETTRFSGATSTPSGLAYDGVSRRFLIADRAGRRLSVVDEFSQHVATLAGSQAGFGEIGALEIDPRDGDLWVVSSGPDGGRATLHKLQLVSGRVLASYPVPDSLGAATLVDVAVTRGNDVLVLDANGGRVLRLQPRSTTLSVAATIAAAQPSSIAPAPGGVVFVATETGVSRIEPPSKTVTDVHAPQQVSLAGVSRLRWYRGALVGVQRQDDGKWRVVRWPLDSKGRRVTGATVLASDIVAPGSPAAAIAGDSLYYLAKDETGVVVNRLKLSAR